MLSSFIRAHATNAFKKHVIPGVGRVVLAASCKGGVGKSTVAMNTAIALSQSGARVGLFDADIYGPSVPTMSATQGAYLLSDKDANFLPVRAHGIETVSVGNCIARDAACLWKGPLVGKVLTDFLTRAAWPALDYLIIDTPPGTGDVHLALAQLFDVDGAVLVSSPQRVANADVARSVTAFKQMRIPVLGLVQNFDGFVCGHCGAQTAVFPGRGGAELAAKHNIPLLGSLPLDPAVAAAADKGVPAIIAHPESAHARVFRTVAETIAAFLPRVEPRAPAKKLE